MEFLIRNFDSHNPDPILDRSGCRKRGMVDAMLPDTHTWGSAECLPKFVVIKADVTAADLEAHQGMRKVWRDELKFEVVESDKVKGEKTLKVTELNPGRSGVNAIKGDKALKVKEHLEKWGCTDHVDGENEIHTKFALEATVKTPEFWGVPAEKLAAMAPAKAAYSSVTEKIQVSLTTADSKESASALMKIMDVAGTAVSRAGDVEVFEVSTDKVLEKVQREVKQRVETTYMYQQHRFDKATVDAAEANGGVLDMKTEDFFAAIVDAADEVEKEPGDSEIGQVK
jgi:hypothetical protein